MVQSIVTHKQLLTQTVSISLALVGFVLVGCSSNEDRPSEQMVDSTHSESADIQIATDIDKTSLIPVSDTYKNLTGVSIEWIPVSATEVIEKNDSNTAESDKPFILTTSEVLSLESGDQPTGKQKTDNKKTTKQQIANQDTANNTGPNTDSVANDRASDVDMLLMHSAYTLDAVSQLKRLQPIGSELLIQTIPEQYQDPQGKWFGLTKYARTLVFNKNKVNEPELHNYAGLGAPKWAGRLCMTPLDKPENQAIAKMMRLFRGKENAQKFVTAWQMNMGEPVANDEQIIKEIEQGRCDVGVIDSDVFLRYAQINPDTPIRLMWTNQINRGAMTNTLTAGLTKTGNDVGKALDFIEWLVSDQGQALLALNTRTFPVINMTDASINMDAVRPDWAKFEEDSRRLLDIMEDKTIIMPVNEVDLEDVFN